jgi:hypothetical protein
MQKGVIETDQPLETEMTVQIKAQTFNGNVVIGTGATKVEAIQAAKAEARKVGSCIKRVI